jgi:subfamily B ATP-binding cassette protein HlyB/CyaB
MDFAELASLSDETVLLLASRASAAAELARFDFTWFVPAIVKYRRLLGEVLVASLFIQLFALATPLFFQVVMDKVLVHKGYSTLTVIGIGLLAVALFESVLSGVRTYVFAHTTSRIDVELGARLFRHLVQLPLAYFEARRFGDSVARVRELEHIPKRGWRSTSQPLPWMSARSLSRRGWRSRRRSGLGAGE